GGRPGVGPGQAGERAQGRGLAGAVGAEEPGNGTRHAGERHPVHRDDPPVALAESGYLDHASSLLTRAGQRIGGTATMPSPPGGPAAGPAPASDGDSRAWPATFVDAARDDRRYRGPGQVPRLEVWLKADHGPGGTWRRWPAGIAVAMLVPFVVSLMAAAAVLLALLNVSIRRRPGAALAIASLYLMVFPGYYLLWYSQYPFWAAWLWAVTEFAAVVAWGMYIRARRQLLASLREQVAHTEAAQKLLAEQARRAERTRIAQ